MDGGNCKKPTRDPFIINRCSWNVEVHFEILGGSFSFVPVSERIDCQDGAPIVALEHLPAPFRRGPLVYRKNPGWNIDTRSKLRLHKRAPFRFQRGSRCTRARQERKSYR